MSDKLIQYALSQRFFTLIVAVLILFFGAKALQEVPVDAYPDISPIQVKIIMKGAGMTPAEMESRVTVPIEQQMQSIPNRTMMRSISKYGIADITIDFRDDVDIYWARQQVGERLSGILGELPGNVEGGLAPITTPLGDILMFTIESDTLSLMEKRSLLDWVISPALRNIDGVADVNALGGYVKTYQVSPDFEAMKRFGITMDAIKEALHKNNQNDGIGRLSIAEQSLYIRTEGRMKGIEDIRRTVITYKADKAITISDVARVEIGSLTRAGFVTKNGEGEAVQGLVLARKGANALQVLKTLKAELAELEKQFPEGTHVQIFYDRSDLVNKAISTVTKALIEATILIVIVLFLFLGNVTSALSVAIILPFAALMTFIAMNYFGISANLMSLGGLAIAIGMLVDAAVVMVEHVSTYLHDKRYATMEKLPLVLRAAKEVGMPITTGIAIIIIVFLPLLTLEGLEGKLFVPVALSIVFALTSSLLLALTLIPVISSMLIPQKESEEVRLVLWLQRHYQRLLYFALAHPKSVVSAAFGLMAVALLAYTQVGKTFMPTLDEGNVIIGLGKDPSIALDASLELDTRIQKALLQNVPEVVSVIARGGSDELGLDPMGLNDTDTFLVLKPKEEWRVPDTEWLLEQFRSVLDPIIGLDYGFTQPIEMRVSEMISGSRGDIAINLYGSDNRVLENLAAEIAAVAESVPGSSDVYKKANDGVAYWQIDFNDMALARYGLSRSEVASYLQSAINGTQEGIIQEELRRIPLMIKSGSTLQTNMQRISTLPFILEGGSSIPLSELVRFNIVEGPVQIDHENAMRKTVVQTNVVGRDLVGFVEELQQNISDKVTLPEGYSIVYGGEYQNQQRAAQRLALIVPLSIGLIFVLLFLSFRSIVQSALVLLNIPFALIGGVFGLYFTGAYLSVPASVGFIALMGIAVLNGVVMVNYFNELARTMSNIDEIVIEGATRRLRPVLMTASIAALGLIPMLFATGPGSEIQQPLAIVVINGLISSTFLTLIMLPILYRRFGLSSSALQADVTV